LTPYVLRPAAGADIEDAYRWYETQRRGLGEEFLAEVQAGLDGIAEHPQLYPTVHRDTRRVLLRRFPYGLFYSDLGNVIVVVACFHAKRDPGGWRDRR
jgi:plasmid stabilization system protein ParE